MLPFFPNFSTLLPLFDELSAPNGLPPFPEFRVRLSRADFKIIANLPSDNFIPCSGPISSPHLAFPLDPVLYSSTLQVRSTFTGRRTIFPPTWLAVSTPNFPSCQAVCVEKFLPALPPAVLFGVLLQVSPPGSNLPFLFHPVSDTLTPLRFDLTLFGSLALGRMLFRFCCFVEPDCEHVETCLFPHFYHPSPGAPPILYQFTTPVLCGFSSYRPPGFLRCGPGQNSTLSVQFLIAP